MESGQVSEVPLASDHAQVRASHSTHIGDVVVTAVDVDESLVKRDIECVELVVVAKQTLQECLVREVKSGEVVVKAVNIL